MVSLLIYLEGVEELNIPRCPTNRRTRVIHIVRSASQFKGRSSRSIYLHVMAREVFDVLLLQGWAAKRFHISVDF